LLKEIEETQHMEKKLLDTSALHRNDMTNEIEGRAPEDGAKVHFGA